MKFIVILSIAGIILQIFLGSIHSKIIRDFALLGIGFLGVIGLPVGKQEAGCTCFYPGV